jgi:ADP-ribose pyrophosphatase
LTAAAERLATRSIYRGKVLDLSVDRVRLPNGAEADLELIHHMGAAVALPVETDDAGTPHALLVRQYRYPTGGWLLEVPGGKLDGGEDPRECARRELIEEIGRRPGELVPLGWIWTTPGFTDEKIWLFLGRDLAPADADPEEPPARRGGRPRRPRRDPGRQDRLHPPPRRRPPRPAAELTTRPGADSRAPRGRYRTNKYSWMPCRSR